MAEDISKNAVLILVTVAVVVSVLSSTLVLNAVYHSAPAPAPVEPEVQRGDPTGRATLVVPGAPETVGYSATGKVALNVP